MQVGDERCRSGHRNPLGGGGLLQQRLDSLIKTDWANGIDLKGVHHVLDVDNVKRPMGWRNTGVRDDNIKVADASSFNFLERLLGVGCRSALDTDKQETRALCDGQPLKLLGCRTCFIAHAANEDMLGAQEILLCNSLTDTSGQITSRQPESNVLLAVQNDFEAFVAGGHLPLLMPVMKTTLDSAIVICSLKHRLVELVCNCL